MTVLYLLNEKLDAKASSREFPGGVVVENPPANAGDKGSTPGPGRSHMPWSNEARAPQLRSLRAQSPGSTMRSHHNEKPAHRNEE